MKQVREKRRENKNIARIERLEQELGRLKAKRVHVEQNFQTTLQIRANKPQAPINVGSVGINDNLFA